MSLACPHCGHEVEYGWMDWEKDAHFQIHFTDKMLSVISNHRFIEEDSRAFLCECPKCKESVVYMVAECPISDITGDTQFFVCKPDEVRYKNER
jgi:predicted RNA-binding Zn-ribbon protein involved in translation (DUF1610 family)